MLVGRVELRISSIWEFFFLRILKNDISTNLKTISNNYQIPKIESILTETPIEDMRKFFCLVLSASLLLSFQ